MLISSTIPSAESLVLISSILDLAFFFGGGLLALATIFFVVFVKNRKTKETDEKSIESVVHLVTEKLD